MKYPIILIQIILLISNFIFAEQQKSIKAIKSEQKITVDGLLNEPVYGNQPAENFYQKEPEEGKLASETTKVWVSYDENNIYIGAQLFDSNPELIDASLNRKDKFTNSDWFYIYLDSYNDKQTGYFFAVNAGGSKMDGILYNDTWDDISWDAIWHAQALIDSEGWTAEIQIPLSQLKFNETDNIEWGINFRRNIKRKNEQDFFVHIPKTENSFVSKFARLEGLSGVKSSSSVEIFPYLVQKAKYLQHDEKDPFYKSGQYPTSFGADLKYALSSNLFLTGTINPDFGQVEVDPAVINLSASETYFDEKRPFFTEGSNFFMFGYGGVNNNWGFNFGSPDLFYSRRIGRSPQGDLPDDYDYTNAPKESRILGAAKITGRVGDGWSLGILDAVTQRTYAKVSIGDKRETYEIEPLTNYSLVRGIKEFDKGRHAIGFNFTGVNRDLNSGSLNDKLSKAAYTLGADGWTTLDKEGNYVLNAMAAGSYITGTPSALVNIQERSYRYSQRPDITYMKLDSNRTSLSGWFFRTMLNKQKGNFYLNASLGAVSPGFEYNDLGYQWMSNRINGHIVTGYRWFNSDGIFREKRVYLALAQSYDFEGDIINNVIYWSTNFIFTNYYSVNFQGNYNFEDYNSSLTRGGPKVKDPSNIWMMASLSSDSKNSVSFNIGTEYGRNDDGGKYFGYWSTISWHPSHSFALTIGPSYSLDYETRTWVDKFSDSTAINTYTNRYVFGELQQQTISGNIRVNWAFSPNLTLELFLQPLFSVGKYSNFKELKKGRTNSFNYYNYNGAQVEYNSNDNNYKIDPDGAGEAEPFEFDNPDFNIKSLRANLVLRWEINPGSIFYFVWTQEKTDDQNPGEMNFRKDFKNLLNDQPDNIFLVKYSHWFSI